MTRSVRFGIDGVLAARDRFGHLFAPGSRVGLVTNDAAVTAAEPARTSRVALVDAGCRLVRLFSPEHGLTGRGPDGTTVHDGADRRTGLPVASLYGERLRPPPALLRELDLVLFDLPDVGVRFFTYAWTLYHVLEACAEARVPLMVLDRPNPIGGDLAAAEGPVLDRRLASFLGRAPIPVRHSLTLGELARVWNDEERIGAPLDVVPVQGWERAWHWPRTGLAFTSPSPALPSYTAALLYPGTCLFEATNVSEGRGTGTPFELIGAPWIDGNRLATEASRVLPPGLEAEPRSFTPRSGRLAGAVCGGVRLRTSAPGSVVPVAAGLRLLALIRCLWPAAFCWQRYATAANPSGDGHFELLIGRSDIRAVLDTDPESVDDALVASWTAPGDWAQRVRPHLLYSVAPQL